MNDVYGRLRERLDDFASGYPTTEIGIEIKILKGLFTKDEAELFLKLSPVLEAPGDVAKRLDRDPAETAELMARMAKKGLIFRLRKDQTARYGAVPFVPGIYDFQLGTMGRGFAQDMQDYFEEGLGCTIQGHKTPIMRPIPINRKLVVEWPIAPYEDVLKIIEDDTAAIDLDRCIGCGLCVTTCPTEAAQLVKKAENEQYQPPESKAEVFMQLAIERKKNIFP